MEEKVSFTVRLPDPVARKFKSVCALKRVTVQKILQAFVYDFLEQEEKIKK